MKKIYSAAACMSLTALIAAGCSNGGETFEEKSYTPDTEIRAVEIDVRDREITVALSYDDKLHISYSESETEKYDISISDENTLTMKYASEKTLTDRIGTKSDAENRKILLQIPDAYLDSLTLSTTNEDISLPPITVTESVSLTVNGGDIAFEKLDVGGSIGLTVKNGDISGSIAGGYDDFSIRSEVKKGESNLPAHKDGGEKTLSASANNGDINIELIPAK